MLKIITASITRCALACERNSLCSVSGITVVNGVATSTCILFQRDKNVWASSNILLIVPPQKPSTENNDGGQQSVTTTQTTGRSMLYLAIILDPARY